MSYDDDFESLMEDCKIGDFSDFILSEEEIEQGKKERKEQLQKDVQELKALIKEAEAAEKEGKRLPSKTARRMQSLASDSIVLALATDSEAPSIDDIVEGEFGTPEKKEEPEVCIDRIVEAIDEIIEGK